MNRNIFVAVLLAVVSIVPSLALGADGSITGKVDTTPTKYLEETVVFVKDAKTTTAAKAKLSMDQKGMKFIPHVMAITAGDSVEFLNNDAVDHNVFTPDNEGYNLGTFKKGQNASHTFDKPGMYQQLCSVHPEMLAFIWVGQNPYHAAVDAKGNYKIEHVPAGTYQLSIWNSHLKGADQSVTVDAGKPATVNFSLKR